MKYLIYQLVKNMRNIVINLVKKRHFYNLVIIKLPKILSKIMKIKHKY